jgi:outer membrane protein
MRVKTSLVAIALAAVAALAAAPDAHAQRRDQARNGVVILDINRVVGESNIGRDMTTRLQAVRGELGPEAQTLQTEARSIEEEGQRVQQATRNLSAEQRQNNAQVQALTQRMNQFQQRRVAFEGGLQCTEAIALRDFNLQITPVVRSVMESRGASVVLGREGVQMASPDADITNTVIEQLNQNPSTRTATVSRRQVSECQAPQQPAAQ